MVNGARERVECAFQAMPLVAILRGLHPDDAVAVGTALAGAGITLIEVPLNSPDPFDSLVRLLELLPPSVAIGAGTVLSPEDARRLADIGGHFLVAPNTDAAVLDAAAKAGLATLPGCLTPTEAFLALRHGAAALKIFPANRMGPGYLGDLRAVLPAGTRLLPVGGVDAANLGDWRSAGADGAGFGSALFKPGMDPAEIEARARGLVQAWRALDGP